jgi:hypothetical protein
VIRILRACETGEGDRFPPTEIFNETWMLRLVLDAFQTLQLGHDGLCFLPGSKWHCEARLSPPFRPQTRSDPLREGLTRADGVIGGFEIGGRRPLRLVPECRQFLVVEAKMFAHFSTRVTYAAEYSQAARSVACIAAAIEQAERPLVDFASLGFLVIAPTKGRRRPGYNNLEDLMRPDAILQAVSNRISAYEDHGRPEARLLRQWEAIHFLPLMAHLAEKGHLSVLSWEGLIETIQKADSGAGEELQIFYERCLTYL